MALCVWHCVCGTVCVALCVWHCVCGIVCVALCLWHCVWGCVGLNAFQYRSEWLGGNQVILLRLDVGAKGT